MRILAPLLLLAAGAAVAQTPLAPPAPFEAEVYRARREAVMKTLGGGLAVLYARGEEDRDGFRPDADFFYLTGLSEPGAILVLAPEERVYRHQLFLAPRDPDAERWEGERAGLGDSLRRATGMDRVRRTTSFESTLMRLLQNTSTLHAIHAPPRPSQAAAPEAELYGKLQARVPGLKVENRMLLLPEMRSVKEARELERMERAIAATESAHRMAARTIRAGVEENWVAAAIDLEFRRGGAVRPAFSSIVGSGPNSTILHYPRHDRTIRAGELVVVDIGADYGGYAADITRTYPADGRFTPRQREIYDLVLRAQRAALAKLKPGVYYEDLHREAERVIAEAGYGDAFLHGLGHFVGLRVHDAGLYGKPLREGMVITLEPGVYLPEENLGVRIEDMYLVTRSGARGLTDGLAREAEAVERLMGGD